MFSTAAIHFGDIPDILEFHATNGHRKRSKCIGEMRAMLLIFQMRILVVMEEMMTLPILLNRKIIHSTLPQLLLSFIGSNPLDKILNKLLLFLLCLNYP